MSACPQCARQVVQAVLADGSRVTLDAAPTPGGSFAAWHTRDGLAWIWRARHKSEGDHLSADHLRALHACPGAAGQQLELGGAA